MADTRLYAEVIHTIVNGFSTTKAPQIDALYRRFNTTFAEEEQYFSYLEIGISRAIEEAAAAEREMRRGYMFQTLALILVDRHFKLGLKQKAAAVAPDVAAAVQAEAVDLAVLIDGLRDPDAHPTLTEFADSTKGTNVGRAKAVRFLYLEAAV